MRSSPGKDRYSVPFFFEPGMECVVKKASGEEDEGVVYGWHVLEKMKGWVEFQDIVAEWKEAQVGVEEVELTDVEG